jgi:hypothetical protein
MAEPAKKISPVCKAGQHELCTGGCACKCHTPEPKADDASTAQAVDANGGLPVDAPAARGIHPNNPQSPRRLTAKQRITQVMEYKLLGASTPQIAEKLGISRQRVHKIITEELARQSEQTRLAVDGYRQLHLNQLDAMEFGIMQQARTGDVFAIDRMLRIQTQRERILPGLAIATKVVAGLGGIDEGGNPAGGAAITIMMTPAEMEVPVDEPTDNENLSPGPTES